MQIYVSIFIVSGLAMEITRACAGF